MVGIKGPAQSWGGQLGSARGTEECRPEGALNLKTYRKEAPELLLHKSPKHLSYATEEGLKYITMSYLTTNFDKDILKRPQYLEPFKADNQSEYENKYKMLLTS